MRWANFEYRTFDLAYYVQALWQLIHGHFQVTVEGVPLLGNHVEPIVFLFVPFFLLVRHPMVFVVLQNAALALMGPIAFSIAKQLGLDRRAAFFLASAILITPASCYVALHEFHPEALAAPFLLLMFRARLRNSLPSYWGWLAAILACKENMALLIIAYCSVQLMIDRKRPGVELRAWYLWPIIVSFVWFLICTKWITPTLNSGKIDYLALYDRLGASGADIVIKAITEPQRILEALVQSLLHGNLVWGLLFPFLLLPILRPRWLVIAAPILMQHLLSWRSSEWTIYFHYAAPIIPLFWLATAESVSHMNRQGIIPTTIRRLLPVLVVIACLVALVTIGPAKDIVSTATSWFQNTEARSRKQAFLDRIPVAASVLAPLPYLSHLAMRENLYSLHYVLKGLKTLSRADYDPPPPTDFVLVDYEDSATFDSFAGYYHPTMKTVDGRVIPSSDRLLHEFLMQARWKVQSINQLTLLEKANSAAEQLPIDSYSNERTIPIGKGSTLIGISRLEADSTTGSFAITTHWNFNNQRDAFPWMFLRLSPRSRGKPITLSRGLCGPEISSGEYVDNWQVILPGSMRGETYDVEVSFVDNTKRLWRSNASQSAGMSLLAPPIPLGELLIQTETGN